jgi:hypothetical protein
VQNLITSTGLIFIKSSFTRLGI